MYFLLCNIFGCVLFLFFFFLSFQRFLVVVKKNMTSNLPSWNFPGGPVADSSLLVQSSHFTLVPDPRIKPMSLASLALAADSLSTGPPGKPW